MVTRSSGVRSDPTEHFDSKDAERWAAILTATGWSSSVKRVTHRGFNCESWFFSTGTYLWESEGLTKEEWRRSMGMAERERQTAAATFTVGLLHYITTTPNPGSCPRWRRHNLHVLEPVCGVVNPCRSALLHSHLVSYALSVESDYTRGADGPSWNYYCNGSGLLSYNGIVDRLPCRAIMPKATGAKRQVSAGQGRDEERHA
jgi:hypothetical protein